MMPKKEVQQTAVTMVFTASPFLLTAVSPIQPPPLADQTKTLAVSEVYHVITTFL
jgi:hypothetical protein